MNQTPGIGWLELTTKVRLRSLQKVSGFNIITRYKGFFFTFLLVFIQCALSHRTIESLCVGSSIEVNLKGPTCNNIPKRGWNDIINPQIRWFEPCPDEIPNYNQ